MRPYCSSRSWTRWFPWSWSSQPGALSVSAAICSLMTGTIASTNRVRATSTIAITTTTDQVRCRPAADEELDQRVEPGRQEHRDDDQDQHRR